MHGSVLSAAVPMYIEQHSGEVRETQRGVPGWGTLFVSRFASDVLKTVDLPSILRS
jgi:hypothetical protein